MVPGALYAQPQLQSGGTVIAAITTDPSNLMTGIGSELEKLPITGQIFDTLIEIGTDFSIRPNLAESWSMSEDGLSYTLNLREGVTWHDGTPFTSEDVAFSILEINSQHNAHGSRAYANVDRVETPDDHTVVVHLTEPDPAFFPWSFSQGNFAQIYPKHIYEDTDPRTNPANFQPIGTGPFKFSEWVRGSHLVLEKNPDYFMADDVYIDRLVFQVIPEPGARVVALERGEIDYIPYFALPPSAIDPLDDNPDIEVINSLTPSLGQIIMWMNNRHEALQHKEVRQAIAYGIDRELIVRLALNDRATPGTSAIRSDSTEFYNPDVRRYPRDVEQANALLDEAGFERDGNGVRFSLSLIYQAGGEGGALQSAAEIMREQLREVGIELELRPSDSPTWGAASHNWEFDLTMGSFGTGPDPKVGVTRFYTTGNIGKGMWINVMGYSNPEVDRLLEAADVELDSARRAGLYKEAQIILAEELPGIWLWEKFYPVAVRAGLVGLPAGALHAEGYKNAGWVQ